MIIWPIFHFRKENREWYRKPVSSNYNYLSLFAMLQLIPHSIRRLESFFFQNNSHSSLLFQRHTTQWRTTRFELRQTRQNIELTSLHTPLPVPTAWAAEHSNLLNDQSSFLNLNMRMRMVPSSVPNTPYLDSNRTFQCRGKKCLLADCEDNYVSQFFCILDSR